MFPLYALFRRAEQSVKSDAEKVFSDLETHIEKLRVVEAAKREESAVHADAARVSSLLASEALRVSAKARQLADGVKALLSNL